jgi:hypothetical protein
MEIKMKKLLTLLPVVLVIGCASGHVSVSTQMPADTDLEIVIKSKQSGS